MSKEKPNLPSDYQGYQPEITDFPHVPKEEKQSKTKAGGPPTPRWGGKGLVPESVTRDLHASQPHRTPEEIAELGRQMHEGLGRSGEPPEAE